MNQPDSSGDVRVRPLTRGDLHAAYPLMREAAPEMSLRRWLMYARLSAQARLGASKGVLLAYRNSVLYPSGAVCYRRDRDMQHGSVLTAEYLIALDLLYPEEVVAALLGALEEVASGLGCGAIRAIVQPKGAGVVEGLRVAGHCSGGVVLTKAI